MSLTPFLFVLAITFFFCFSLSLFLSSLSYSVSSSSRYQIVALTRSTGQATARRILLELPSYYQKHLKSPASPLANPSLEQNLGDTVSLPIKDVAMFPQLGGRAFKYFAERNVRIMETEATLAALEAASPLPPPLESTSGGEAAAAELTSEASEASSSDDRGGDGGGGGGEGALFEANFEDGFNAFAPPSGLSPARTESLSSSDSDSSLDSFCHSAASSNSAGANLPETRRSFSDLFGSSGGHDRAAEAADEWDEIVNRKATEAAATEAAAAGRAVTPEKEGGREAGAGGALFASNLEATQFGARTTLEPDLGTAADWQELSGAAPRTPRTRFSRAKEFSSVDVSPSTVCVTFVQSRSTEIQFHGDVSDDEIEEQHGMNNGAYSNVLSM